MKIQRISGSKFTWEKFACRQGISQLDIVTSDFRMLTGNGTALGWCYARELPVRPRSTGAAIMVQLELGEEPGEETTDAWIHVPDSFARDYCEGFNQEESESIGGPLVKRGVKYDSDGYVI